MFIKSTSEHVPAQLFQKYRSPIGQNDHISAFLSSGICFRKEQANLFLSEAPMQSLDREAYLTSFFCSHF